MFNLKHKREAQVTSTEKYLREQNIGPKSDDTDPIYEKKMPHWTGDATTITEDQMDSSGQRKEADDKILEKLFEESKSYVTHRSDNAALPVMPIQALVEKMRQERLDNDWEPTKKKHWSQKSEKKQQGSLPKWPKHPAQHDKPVLNNDPQRFKGLDNMPIHEDQRKNDAVRDDAKEITPLVGDITVSDIDNVARLVKTGGSIDYDTAIVAMLREADQEERELTQVERKAIVQLKSARTRAMLKK